MIKFYHEKDIDGRLKPFFDDQALFSKSDLDSCDFIFYHDVIWDGKPSLVNKRLGIISQKYAPLRKFILIFIVSDFEKRYDFYPNLLIFRTSLRASLRRNNEFPLPYIWNLYPTRYEIMKNHDLPKVGFCGLGSRYRNQLLKVFSQSQDIDDNFIIREKFWGGNPHHHKVIEEFDNNIRESHYVISQRGRGNFSMRFYQTLSAGRIPVLIDTDMILPFDDKIDWENSIVFEKDAKSCLSKVIQTFENGDYKKMQDRCYEIYITYFSQSNFAAHVVDVIKHRSYPSKDDTSFLQKLFYFFK